MRKVVGSNPDDALIQDASFSFANWILLRDCEPGLLRWLRDRKSGLLETKMSKRSFESTFFDLEVAPSTIVVVNIY